MLARIDALKDLLNEHPLVPRDPRNRREAFVDMASGVRLPDVHCAFRGCVWCQDIDSTPTSRVGFLQWEVEWHLFKHLMQEHAEAFQQELEACHMEVIPVPGGKPFKYRVPKQFPDIADLPRRTGESQWQCDLFLQVHSV